MATMTLPCRNLSMAYSSSDGWVYGTDKEAFVGYAGGVRYDAAILRFDAPYVPGASEALDLSLAVRKNGNSNVRLRWAVCTSDANKEKYRSTTNTVADKNQIASGTILLDNLTDKDTVYTRTFQIPVEGIGKGTWYLILWAYESSGAWLEPISTDKGSYGISVVCAAGGVVRAKTADGVKAFAAYNGRRKRLIPYAKTASGIRPVS